MRNKKTAIVFAAVLALTQARAAFADAGNDLDFLKYLHTNDMRKLEKLVNSKAKKMDLDYAMGRVFYEDSFNKANALRVIQLLVRNGANVNSARYGYSNYIPLVLATYSSNFTEQQRVDIARYLLDNGSNVNATSAGNSPIGQAAGRNNWELVKLLLERGANPNVKSSSGISPMRYAAASNQLELVKLLLEKGANPNDGSLYTAAGNGHFELVKLLLEKRANPNGRFDDDSTALIWAAKKDYNEIAYELVESGANVNLRNTKGETAASIAYDRGNIELYNYLLAYGAVLFEPKQAAAPPPAQAPQSTTTNVYVQPPAPSYSSSGSSSPPPAAPQPKKRMFTGQVWYLDNGTRKSIPLMEQAFTADEAEKAAERKFKSGPVGLQKGVIFLEAVAN